MINHILKGFILIVIFLLVVANTEANVMNLNEFMPTQLEDVSVADENTVEIQASARWKDEEETLTFRPNIRWGLIKRVHLEYSSDHITGPSHSETGSGDSQLGLQWNFNDQDDWVPSFAVSPQFTFPTGKESEGIDPSWRINMTYTLVGTLSDPVGQFHLNHRWSHNSNRKAGEGKVGKLLAFGYSHKLSDKHALVADFIHDKDVFNQDTKNEVELGYLQELSKRFLLGLGGGLDVQNGYYTSTLAIQTSF